MKEQVSGSVPETGLVGDTWNTLKEEGVIGEGKKSVMAGSRVIGCFLLQETAYTSGGCGGRETKGTNFQLLISKFWDVLWPGDQSEQCHIVHVKVAKRLTLKSPHHK